MLHNVKLDENLGSIAAALFKSAGVNVSTVADQNLQSATDADLAQACSAEGRCLVTLDKDFADPFRYPPTQYSGIVVIRLPGRFTIRGLERAIALVMEASRESDVRGRLWIAEVDRVREYQQPPE